MFLILESQVLLMPSRTVVFLSTFLAHHALRSLCCLPADLPAVPQAGHYAWPSASPPLFPLPGMLSPQMAIHKPRFLSSFEALLKDHILTWLKIALISHLSRPFHFHYLLTYYPNYLLHFLFIIHLPLERQG